MLSYSFATIENALIAISTILNATKRPIKIKSYLIFVRLAFLFNSKHSFLETPVSIIISHFFLYFFGIAFNESFVLTMIASDSLHIFLNQIFDIGTYLLIFLINSKIFCFNLILDHNSTGIASPPPKGPHINLHGSLYINVGNHIFPNVIHIAISTLYSFTNFFDNL